MTIQVDDKKPVQSQPFCHLTSQQNFAKETFN